MYELIQLASLFSSGPNKDSIKRFLIVQGSGIFKIQKKNTTFLTTLYC